MGFTVNGLDEFSLSLHEIAEMPDSTKENMLEAGGVVAIKALKQQIDALGMVDTGQLRESIAPAKKRLARNDYEPSLLIYPQGTRRGRTTKKGKKSEMRKLDLFTSSAQISEASPQKCGCKQLRKNPQIKWRLLKPLYMTNT